MTYKPSKLTPLQSVYSKPHLLGDWWKEIPAVTSDDLFNSNESKEVVLKSWIINLTDTLGQPIKSRILISPVDKKIRKIWSHRQKLPKFQFLCLTAYQPT